MIGSARLSVARLATRHALPLLVTLVAAFGVAACGDDDGPTGGGSGIEGTWLLQDEDGTFYVRITSTTVSTFIREGTVGCFVRSDWSIVSRSGNTVRISSTLTGPFDVEMQRSGDNLVIEGETFQRSNQNVSNLDICQTPTFAACATYPAIAVGSSVAGTITSSDPAQELGRRYDLYRFNLAATTTVSITMTSMAFDTYLYLFDSAGNLLAEDDDGTGTLNSLIVETLPAGCYIVMAASYGSEDTGAYQVFVHAD